MLFENFGNVSFLALFLGLFPTVQGEEVEHSNTPQKKSANFGRQ